MVGHMKAREVNRRKFHEGGVGVQSQIVCKVICISSLLLEVGGFDGTHHITTLSTPTIVGSYLIIRLGFEMPKSNLDAKASPTS